MSGALLASSDIWTYVILAVFIVVIVVFFVFSSRRNKKKQQEAEDLINAVKPGNKVKTIGGVCGIVVEVDAEENTFVLETGSEQSGKCYLKFDRQAIYQTDAVVEKPEDKKDEKSEGEEEVASEADTTSEDPFDETATSESAEEQTAEDAEEQTK